MPERVQLSRRSGWRMPPNTVSVARPHRFGNPFRVGETVLWSVEGGPVVERVRDRAQAVTLHSGWLRGVHNYIGIPNPPNVAPLRGRNLACFCPLGEPCHSDALLELANQEATA